MDRLEAVMRITIALKKNIEANNNLYDSRMAPNFQSIFDVGLGMTDEMFSKHVTEESLRKMEASKLPSFSSYIPDDY